MVRRETVNFKAYFVGKLKWVTAVILFFFVVGTEEMSET